MSFETFFESAMGRSPYPYQRQLAHGAWRETLVVPTGFGKTAAVLAAWLWKRKASDPDTPRRLVYCLPMRTLVEQTAAVAEKWIEAAKREIGVDVTLDILMGGRSTRRRIPEWIMHPEKPAILIGTQDLLVSAALMRGYGTTRFRWPVDFALLHNDALWVFDEVQLTGAALATSAQLEAARREDRVGAAKPSRTLWMSATLDPAWLTTVDFTPTDEYRANDLSKEDIELARPLWVAKKRLAQLAVAPRDLSKPDGVAAFAREVAQAAVERTRGGASTIVFLNTVRRAQAVFDALPAGAGRPERLLVHSRFRAAERRALRDRFERQPPAEGRIVVATQALEAGVDVTSSTMITEIAPWSSLVQRFGRCNRRGECGDEGAEVLWVDLPDEHAAPYAPEELGEARGKLAGLMDSGPAALAEIRPSAPPRGQVVRRRDLLDLFDTDPDLSGFDVDVSMYVRNAQDTDVRLFWRAVQGAAPPDDAPAPQPDELCPAPIGDARELVKRARGRAWRWDALDKTWRSVAQDTIYPGLVLWVDAAVGGYDAERGFDPLPKHPVAPVAPPEITVEPSDDLDGDRDSEMSAMVSLAKHSAHVRDEMAALGGAGKLDLPKEDLALLLDAALHHDWGKAHEAFVALTAAARAERGAGDVLLAKWPSAPKGSGRPPGARRHFRHELASALAYLETRGWSDEASLAAYLIAAHHGKVRMRLRALPKETAPEDGRLFARGVWSGDALPPVRLAETPLPAVGLDLDIMQLGDSERCGASWSTRAQRLLEELGPFRLAWLEALLRIADWRASAEEELAHDDL